MPKSVMPGFFFKVFWGPDSDP